MKIKPEDLEVLRQRVSLFDTPERRVLYKTGQFVGSSMVRDLNLRYRWDLLWLSKIKIGDGAGDKGDLDLYSYMNDDHIDTALKSFIPPLN